MKQEVIWDYYQNTAPEYFSGSIPRLRDLLTRLQKAKRVLNIGVGSGLFEGLALQAGHDVYSLDPSQRSIEALRERFGLGEKAVVGYSQAIPFPDGFFDAVLMSEVLEHLDDDTLRGTVKEVARVLKHDGLFVGTVPYRENLAENQVVCPNCATNFHRWGHVRDFDKETMSLVLRPSFRVVVIEPRYFPDYARLNFIGKLAALVKATLNRFGNTRSGATLVFEGRRQ